MGGCFYYKCKGTSHWEVPGQLWVSLQAPVFQSYLREATHPRHTGCGEFSHSLRGESSWGEVDYKDSSSHPLCNSHGRRVVIFEGPGKHGTNLEIAFCLPPLGLERVTG